MRYLGDVNGGQILSKKLAQSFDLKDGMGLEFYSFPKIDNIRGFSKTFKDAMDKVVDPKLQEDLIAEANKSYQLQIDIFSSLA